MPRSTYDQALRENEELRRENKFLKDTLRELQFNVFTKYGEEMQQAWREITDRQLAMNREMGRVFLELFK